MLRNGLNIKNLARYRTIAYNLRSSRARIVNHCCWFTACVRLDGRVLHGNIVFCSWVSKCLLTSDARAVLDIALILASSMVKSHCLFKFQSICSDQVFHVCMTNSQWERNGNEMGRHLWIRRGYPFRIGKASKRHSPDCISLQACRTLGAILIATAYCLPKRSNTNRWAIIFFGSEDYDWCFPP